MADKDITNVQVIEQWPASAEASLDAGCGNGCLSRPFAKLRFEK